MDDTSPVLLGWTDVAGSLLTVQAGFENGLLWLEQKIDQTSDKVQMTEREAELLYGLLKTRFGRRR